MVEDKINYVKQKFITEKPFFGYMLMRTNFVKADWCPTIGVSVGNSIKCYYNEAFVTKLSTKALKVVLEHEILHLVLDHHGRRADRNPAVANIAADMAINQMLNIEVLADLKPVMLPKGWTSLETMEYYYKKLMESAQKTQSKMEDVLSDSGTLVDDHGTWDKAQQEDGVTQEQAEATVKNAIKQVCEQVDVGTLPQQLRRALEDRARSKVDWKSALQRFFTRQRDNDQQFTRTKRNRRFGTLLPGYKDTYKLRIGVIVDTSGSIDKDLLSQFWAEITKIYDAGGKLTIISCDAKVHQEIEYKRGMQMKLHGGGGTLYQPAFDAAAKYNFDAVVLLGDGFCADKPNKPKFPVLWALTTDHRPAEWGHYMKLAS